MIVKIVATFLRYQVFLGSDKRSDAIQYNQYGQDYIHGIAEPLDDLRKTNFIRFLTAHVYVLIGPDLIAAFLVFGIFAFFGAYLWYRATAEGVPSLNRQMYCALLFFAPSLAFWPSSVGKEAMMLPALGLVALGTAYLLKGRLLHGFLVAAPGRLVVVGGPAASPRVRSVRSRRGIPGPRRGGHRRRGPRRCDGRSGWRSSRCSACSRSTRPPTFLGMKDFSFASIEQELADQSARLRRAVPAFEPDDPVHLTP